MHFFILSQFFSFFKVKIVDIINFIFIKEFFCFLQMLVLFPLPVTLVSEKRKKYYLNKAGEKTDDGEPYI